MSPVEFKKMACHPVEFKGQGPPEGLVLLTTRHVRSNSG